MRVAIQGTRGSFSEAAARLRWPDLELVPCREVGDVAAAVREGRADAGCLAIENSLVGSVTPTYDLLHEAFGDGTLHLNSEVLLPVHHALMAVPGAPLSGITRVLSHPVALGQCRIWLGRHLPNVEQVSAWDTAGSAEIVARSGDPTQAAIAPSHAAAHYGLELLEERIEDDPTNQTRFLTFTSANLEIDHTAPTKTSSHRLARPPAGDAGGGAAGLRRARHQPDRAAVAPRALGALDLSLLLRRRGRRSPTRAWAKRSRRSRRWRRGS